jgi:hypothetical protein
MNSFPEGERQMRIAKSIFVGWLAALVLAAAPALAKNSDGQTEDKQASVSCHAYQKAPDGSWTPLPCGDMDAKAPQKDTARGQRTR